MNSESLTKLSLSISDIYLANSWDNFVFPVPELPVKIANGLTFKDNK